MGRVRPPQCKILQANLYSLVLNYTHYNILNSSQPAYLLSFLSYHIPAHSLSMLPQHQSDLSSVGPQSTQPLLPVVSVLLPTPSVTNSLLAYALVLHHTYSIIILKPTTV